MVHQHFMLAPNLTVAENLILPNVIPNLRPINAKQIKHATHIAKQLEWNLPIKQKVQSLSVGQRQRIEIIKALQNDPDVLILDEPTATLTQNETNELLQMIRNLKAKGNTVVLIAHKLSEVMAVADHVSVLRFGKITLDAKAKTITTNQVAIAMTGEEEGEKETAANPKQEVIAQADKICLPPSVNEASLCLHKGEILGIGGVDGNGQTQLAEILAGILKPTSGTLIGFQNAAYIPPDRTQEGLVTSLTVAENLILRSLNDQAVVARGWIKQKQAQKLAESLMNRFDIRAISPNQSCRSLSGGNQQKVVVARELAREPMVTVAVYPTRGLDLKSSKQVQSQIALLAKSGAAVVLFSNDPDELKATCNRTLFMIKGKVKPNPNQALTS
jgi:simple sugar transport system ATP-binding protein